MQKEMKIITALVTPFNPDLSINYHMVDQLIERQIAEGADGIVIGGTTGEAHLLDKQEMYELYHYVVKYAKRIPIYLGVGSASTNETLKLIKRFNHLDVAGFLVVVPYYVLPAKRPYQTFSTAERSKRKAFNSLSYSKTDRNYLNLRQFGEIEKLFPNNDDQRSLSG